MEELEKLRNENNQLKEILDGIDLYREQKLNRALGDIPNIDLIIKVRDIILKSKQYSEMIFKAIGLRFFQDDYMASILITGSIIENYRFSIVNIKEEKIPTLINSDNFVNSLVVESVMQVLAMSESYDSYIYNHFSYNPVVATSFSIAEHIIKRIDSGIDKENMDNLHGTDKPFFLIPTYLRDAMNSLTSTIILLTHGAYTQAFGTLRTLIEQVIIISTIAHYPEALEKFEYHIHLKHVEELEKNKKEVDKYLESQDILPTNMTLRSKYVDYGWLDSIEDFKTDKSKKMYRVKTMAKLIGMDEQYEWYADWSNYVHSNFLTMEIDWNYKVNEAVNQISYLITNMQNLYMWLTGYDFSYKGINLYKYMLDLRVVYKTIEEETNNNYEFIKK
ncbi:MAG: DUF5677 domain-containing protein [Acholeplasmatales bacterium]|nr:DUF5677 domain-containing protein [Acholeplasmatales bacterium]